MSTAIRDAHPSDAASLAELLEELGYPAGPDFNNESLESWFGGKS